MTRQRTRLKVFLTIHCLILDNPVKLSELSGKISQILQALVAVGAKIYSEFAYLKRAKSCPMLQLNGHAQR